MLPKRSQIFNSRHDSVFPFPDAVAPPTMRTAEGQKIDQQVQAQRLADARAVEFAGDDTSFAQFGCLVPVRFAVNLTTVPILTFVVPAGRVLSVSRVQIGFSEPMCYTNSQFGWRLVLNGRQVPFHGSQGLVVLRTDILPIPFGGIEPNSEVSPVHCATNSTVQVELVELNLTNPPTPFEEYLVAWAWLFGTLQRTAGGV